MFDLTTDRYTTQCRQGGNRTFDIFLQPAFLAAMSQLIVHLIRNVVMCEVDAEHVIPCQR